MLLSCDDGHPAGDKRSSEPLMTQQSDTLTIVSSKNGRKNYRFYTPLMERYQIDGKPYYMEFRRGIDMVTLDSLGRDESTIVSNYAIYLEPQELWEAKGNVVVTNAEGQVLETQQLFWNQKTGRVYSNVDTKITQESDVIYGTGFESDDKFADFVLRQPMGRVGVDIQPTDSTAAAGPDAAGAHTLGPSDTVRRATAPAPVRATTGASD